MATKYKSGGLKHVLTALFAASGALATSNATTGTKSTSHYFLPRQCLPLKNPLYFVSFLINSCWLDDHYWLIEFQRRLRFYHHRNRQHELSIRTTPRRSNSNEWQLQYCNFLYRKQQNWWWRWQRMHSHRLAEQWLLRMATILTKKPRCPRHPIPMWSQ